jgi:diguanylate cyclase (GGDEF)-like protein
MLFRKPQTDFKPGAPIVPSEIFQLFFVTIPDFCAILDETGKVVHANFQGIGRDLDETGLQTVPFCQTFCSGAAACPGQDCLFQEVLQHHRAALREIAHPLFGHLELQAFPLTKRNSDPVRVALRVRDLTAVKQTEQRLQKLAHHDTLTGLPNRALLMDRLEQAISKARRFKRGLAILFLDLDRFKKINDSLGHEVGDMILCQVARRLQGVLRETDTVSRLSGDEFVIICEELKKFDDAGHLAEKLLATFRDPFQAIGHTMHLSSSIGVAQAFIGGEDGKELLRQADIAMYEAKRHGGNQFQIYCRSMKHQVDQAFFLEELLRRGLDRNEFFLEFQPQIDLRTQRLIGLESLVRWGEAKTCVPPGMFIQRAEESGLIVPLGEWILKEACAQGVRWQQQGGPNLQIAVNISARQFAQADFADRVIHILQGSGLDPTNLELEITESAIMENVDRAIATMHRLKQLGIQFALDDFGIGYSSLKYLRNLPLSKLKIDRSFVRELPFNTGDVKLVTSILALAGSFGLKTVAEGIETEKQLSFLTRLKCQIGQGYLFSRPVSPAAIPGLLQKFVGAA